VLLIHHSGKDETRGARGWSGLRAAADAELEVIRSDDLRALTVTKQKDGEDGAEFGFRLLTVTIGVDEDLEPITSCVVEHGEHSARDVRSGTRKLRNGQQIAKDTIESLMDQYGTAIQYEEAIKACVDALPEPENGRDRRREVMVRTVDSLVKDRVFKIEGGMVSK
jgi:hypothetical protein